MKTIGIITPSTDTDRITIEYEFRVNIAHDAWNSRHDWGVQLKVPIRIEASPVKWNKKPVGTMAHDFNAKITDEICFKMVND